MPKMLREQKVKRNINQQTFGQKLTDHSVIAFQKRQHCDVTIKSADGTVFRAHQVGLEFSIPL